MSESLSRFDRIADISSAIKMAQGEMVLSIEETGFEVDFAPVDAELKRLLEQPPNSKVEYDIRLAPILHQQLAHVPLAKLTDMRIWHWMAIVRYPELVWTRWGNGVPEDVGKTLPGLASRFLGSRSMRGRARNALARLQFASELLYTEDTGYDLVEACFSLQDRHQAIFEREYGLLGPVARAVTQATRESDGKSTKLLAKRLNHIGSTVALECLTEKEVVGLLAEQ